MPGRDGATELELARRALAGDKEAWDALFSGILQPYINGLAAKMFLPQNPDLFEEASLEAVYLVYANLHRFRGEAKLTTWSYFYIMQAISKGWKHMKKARQTTGIDEEGVLERSGAVEWSPEQKLEQRFLMLKIEEALAGMSPIYRRAIEWQVLQGLTPAEIAAREGVGIQTVKSWLKRARKKLKEHFGEETAHDE